jgi:hypothetical protein
MEYPSTLPNRIKYWFWVVYSRFYPALRGAAHRLGIGRLFIEFFEPGHSGRQEFLLGTLHPERPVRDFALFLIKQGFGSHFIAWKDSGELLSLRRTDGFEYQYHLRIFKDGEVRCHYEYTPECHPFLHMIRVGFEDRSSEFKDLLQDWIVPVASN